MKALCYVGPNELAVKEKGIPEIGPGEVLIKVAYAGICGTDTLAYHGGMTKRTKPFVILGHEFSGTVHEAGPSSSFQKGDRVTVEPITSCGECDSCQRGVYNLCTVAFNLIGIDSDGAFAEYIKVPESKVYPLGDTISMQAGALIEPLAVCVHAVEKGNISAGQTVLVVGGGPIGIITALTAQQRGANVFISEINPYRIQVAHQLGFEVLNPTEANFLDQIHEKTRGCGVDAAIEATGTNNGIVTCIEAARTKGIVVIAGLPKKKADFDVYRIIAKELQLVGTRVYMKEDYDQAIELLSSGRLDLNSLISKVVPLEEAIVKGFEAIDNGEDAIKILISISNEDEKL
ncbi:zinc-binding dehydrogenase [Bacillus sp. FJAT-29814]|uniref:zinc-dependent alcohol dehydrogenase n=1 Tax=Bacillus sp. FJAT-29814 TaxID=1729688 RepID=UPI00082A67E9|nr:alcohol dehydrogenase catalytic domain-containing protein [Bacillus sp. FJAT-29814]